MDRYRMGALIALGLLIVASTAVARTFTETRLDHWSLVAGKNTEGAYAFVKFETVDSTGAIVKREEIDFKDLGLSGAERTALRGCVNTIWDKTHAKVGVPTPVPTETPVPTATTTVVPSP